MTFRTIILAAVTTAAAAASAAVYLATAPSNAPAGESSDQGAPASSSARREQDLVVVCVGPDRIVRGTLPSGECPAGHKEESLEPPEEEECPLCPPTDGPEPEKTDDTALNDLERRIRALENAPYFEVVNDSEQPVFRVGPDGVSVFNRSGVAVAAFGVSQYGGYFTASSGSALLQATMSASGTKAGVQIVEDDLVRLSAMAGEEGGSSLQIPSANGVIAGMGASKVGSGALLIGGLDGRLKASLTVPDGRGLLQLGTGNNGGQLSLLEQGIGGGMFQIDNNQGKAAIKMGHLNHRYGIVLAGPNLGFPLVPKSGLPGSYFMGCGSQSPPACVPNVP
jgi:hypothetical protein